MHLVRHPRSSELSAALLLVRVGSACNVNSHSLGLVQLGPVRFGSARLVSACSVNEPLCTLFTFLIIVLVFTFINPHM